MCRVLSIAPSVSTRTELRAGRWVGTLRSSLAYIQAERCDLIGNHPVRTWQPWLAVPPSETRFCLQARPPGPAVTPAGTDVPSPVLNRYHRKVATPGQACLGPITGRRGQ